MLKICFYTIIIYLQRKTNFSCGGEGLKYENQLFYTSKQNALFCSAVWSVFEDKKYYYLVEQLFTLQKKEVYA